MDTATQRWLSGAEIDESLVPVLVVESAAIVREWLLEQQYPTRLCGLRLSPLDKGQEGRLRTENYRLARAAVARRLALKTDRQKLCRARRDRIIELVESGMTYKEVGRIVGQISDPNTPVGGHSLGVQYRRGIYFRRFD